MKSLVFFLLILAVPSSAMAQIPQCTQPNRIHRLLCQLTDIDADVRKTASDGLSKLGTKAVPDLIAALENDRKTIRWAAGSVLGRIGKPALNAVLKSLKHKNPQVREQAARCLGIMATKGSFGHRRKAVITALKKATQDPDDTVSKRATHALGAFGADGTPAIAALIKNLKHKDYLVRFAAADSLGNLGPKASSAIPALIKAMKDRNWPVKRSVAIALGKMGPLGFWAVPTLVRSLKNQRDILPPDAYTLEKVKAVVRQSIVEAIGNIGPMAGAVIPTLVQVAINDSSVDVRRAAAEALAKLGPKGKQALSGPDGVGDLKQVFERGRKAESAAKMKQATVHYRQVMACYLSSKASLKTRDGSIAAQAAFRLGEIELRKLKSMKKSGGMSQLPKDVVRWHKQFIVTRAAFEEVHKIKIKKWSVAATCRLGATNYQIVSLYMSVPPTEKMKQLGEEGVLAFKDALLGQADRYLKAAQKHYKYCLQHADSSPYPIALSKEARFHLALCGLVTNK